ncbi:MAG: DUF2306 domain-containing protein [Pseudomonadota bacterium]
MSLSPFLDAGLAIQLHTLIALAALGLGLWQLIRPKGTCAHRRLGLIWTTGMMISAAASFFINEGRQLGPFSAIHLLSLSMLIGLPLAVRAARRGRIRLHAALMLTAIFGGLVFAGALALLPGRLLHDMLTGS